MTIDEIYKNEEISIRSYNVCKYNSLDSIDKLKEYYIRNRTFETLRNCGRRSNEELIEICKTYQASNVDNIIGQTSPNLAQMTLEQLGDKENLSKRSFNICGYNGLRTLSDILVYYNKHKSFESLRNCGRRSNEELIEICKKYQTSNIDNTIEQTNKNSLGEILANLTRIQREVINSFILVNANSLSARNKKAISQFLNGNFSIRNFAAKILLNKKFIPENIKNIGKGSIPELEIYISIVNDFIIDVKEAIDEKQLITLKNNFLIQRTFSIPKISSEILQSESIFQLTDFLFKNNALFNENYNLIIQKAVKIYQNDKELTLDEIASENNLSRERVRQIRKDCINELFKKLSFIKNFNDDLFQNYGIDLSSNLIEVKENLVSQINIFSNTNFSKEFISYILAVYLSDDFVIIGNIEDVLLPKISSSRNRHNWNNFYVVNKELSKVDFKSFANELNERVNERIEETYSFNFKSYISKFIKDLNIEIIELAFPIAEKIINDEFDLYLDLNDNIVFKRNTIKKGFEYAYEALECLGKPSKVKEITQKIMELHPNYEIDENKVRTSMKRENGFVPVGRKSVFGLKKWEDELDDFKGGTIRSISIEFLNQFDSPKHVSEITEYVLKYRPDSNDKSIIYNLRIDESGMFRFFENSYIGLSSKSYSDDFKIQKETKKVVRKSWNERYNDLIDFIKINNSLPYYNSSDPTEKTLFRWLNTQKYSKKLSEDQKKLINEIIESQ